MQKAILLFAAVALAAAPVTAQTPAATPPSARVTTAPTGDSARFAAIRGRFRRELATERAALERTRDRMREELVAAGWRPRMREAGMRVRMAGFRSRLRDRMRMRHRSMMGRQPMMMRRGPMMMGRGAPPMMGRGAGPMMAGGRRGVRPGAPGNDSTRAMRRPPPRAMPDSGRT